MAFSVTITCSESFHSSCTPEKTMLFLTQYNTSIGKYFDSLESFSKSKDDTYHWKFKTLSYGGSEFNIQFLTTFESKGNETLLIIPVDKNSKMNLTGRWDLLPDKGGTLVRFNVTLVGELPLPSFTKSFVTPLAQREVSKIFSRYITNVSKAI
ncbi:MAG: hypothetical protein NT000_08235 [Proteobacteria bacterium]|nr:hypothetical protein [Pseudomonadota bacterium]NQW44235.1 hypothetical protein [Deltaproteobacteria bacterium]